MKNLKKILSLALALLMLVGVLAACGDSGTEEPGETTPNGGFAQINKAIVAYNSSGYGDTWLRESARVFNEMYADEGYEIELKISYGNESNATLEIGKGADKNDVDLYLGAGNLEKLLEGLKSDTQSYWDVRFDYLAFHNSHQPDGSVLHYCSSMRLPSPVLRLVYLK